MTYFRTDFHIHLEGAVSWEWLKTKNNSLEESPNWLEKDFRFNSLSDFVSCFRTFMDAFSTWENYVEASKCVIEKLIQNRVKYAEIVFGPKLSSLPKEEALKTLYELNNITDAYIKKGITIRWFGAMTAPMDFDINQKFYDILISQKCISGIDLAGVEELMDINPYIDIYKDAKNRGLKRKAHAGETTGSEEILKRIENLDLQQAGHALSLKDNPDLMSLIKEKDILIELCPVSNYKLSRINKISDHPILTYIKNNIPITLCTDDPLFFQWHDYMDKQIKQHLGLDDIKIENIYKNSMKYAIDPYENS